MIMNGGTPIVFYNPGKSQAQKQRQRQAKQRQIISQKRLNQLIKQIKQKRIHEQVLLKRSKHLKQWRERKLIITQTMIGTFEVKKDKIVATQWVPLQTITSCVAPVQQKKDPQGMFILSFYGQDKKQSKLNFRFACKTKQQRDKWIQIIKTYAKNCAK